MLILNRPASNQKDSVQIHVRLVNNQFFVNTDEQMRTLSEATSMSHAPFAEFFATMVAHNKVNALHSPLYQAFTHCFPGKAVIIDESASPLETVRVINVKIAKEEAISIVSDLAERVLDDQSRFREVQSVLNVLETADQDTYPHWIRIARLHAVDDPLDQIHVEKL